MKTCFSTNPLTRLVESHFLPSRNNMLLFGAFFLPLETMIDIRGESVLTEKYFLASGNHFRLFCLKKQLFRIVETHFPTNSSFTVVKKRIMQTISFFLSSGNVFLKESFIPAVREWWKPSTLLHSSFLLAGSVTYRSANCLLHIDIILASGNSFSS